MSRGFFDFPAQFSKQLRLTVKKFKDLAEALPEHEWVVCQEQTLTKDEYHKLLGEAKVVFSANLQETLGISMYEGAILNAIPIVPDRLSYTEMWLKDLKYPSEWTATFDKYEENKDKLIALIKAHIEDYDSLVKILPPIVDDVTAKFFTATGLVEELFKTK